MTAPFIHPDATCESDEIGDGTRIWAFAYVLAGARIGRDANICSHTFIEGDVIIGDRVTVKSGVQLWDGLRIEDDVFIGPNATFTNDRFPRSKARPDEFPVTTVCRGASIGANATVLPGLTIGRHAMVGAGAVVTRSVPPNAVVVGNPARIRGYTDADRPPEVAASSREESREGEVRGSSVSDVSLRRSRFRRDLRGSLVACEFGRDVPFEPRRSFLVYDVPGSEIRGEHAHRTCEQFIVCVRGACRVLVDDGRAREEFHLDDPTLGLYVPAMVWCSQFGHTPDAMLLVLASEHYDPDDYIRDYDAWLEALGSGGA